MNSRWSIALAFCCAIFATSAFASDLNIPATWIQVKAGKSFSFYAPHGTAPYSDGGRAEDSFVGMYRNSDFTLMFDYGWYSNSLSGYSHEKGFVSEQTVIDGRQALIVTGPGTGEWGCEAKLSAVYLVADRGWFGGMPNRLEMNGCAKSQKGIELLHRVFHTLKFSDDADWRANFHFKQN